MILLRSTVVMERLYIACINEVFNFTDLCIQRVQFVVEKFLHVDSVQEKLDEVIFVSNKQLWKPLFQRKFIEILQNI